MDWTELKKRVDRLVNDYEISNADRDELLEAIEAFGDERADVAEHLATCELCS